MSEELHLGSLLAALDEHRVAYLITGSVAATAHGAPGVEPADLDIVPATDVATLESLASALEMLEATAEEERGAWRIDEAGERVWDDDGVARPVAPLDPSDPSSFDHSYRTAHGRLDIVPEIAGAYDDLRRRAVLLEVAGSRRWVVSALDLLAGLTRPRRPKDAPRIAHLRGAARTPASSGAGFVGFRTERFDEMVGLFRDRIGLAVIKEAPGATWFRLGSDAELHVYAATDPDHAFFTTGPVVGLRVDDVDATRAALEADGLLMLTEIERTEDAAWCHFRAPDGTVMEIIGPA